MHKKKLQLIAKQSCTKHVGAKLHSGAFHMMRREVHLITCFKCFSRRYPANDACHDGVCRDTGKHPNLDAEQKVSLTRVFQKKAESLRALDQLSHLDSDIEVKSCGLCGAQEKTDKCYFLICYRPKPTEVGAARSSKVKAKLVHIYSQGIKFFTMTQLAEMKQQCK